MLEGIPEWDRKQANREMDKDRLCRKTHWDRRFQEHGIFYNVKCYRGKKITNEARKEKQKPEYGQLQTIGDQNNNTNNKY